MIRVRMRRRVKRLPNMAQRAFGFTGSGGPAGPEPAFAPGDDWFQPDGHRELRVGEEPLDRYLRQIELGWVLQVRALLEALDWSLLTRAYQPTGRKAKHPRVMVGLIVYGILSGRWSLRELELLARRDVGAWWICGGHHPDHSTIGEFVQRHHALLSTAFFEHLVRYLVGRLRLQAGTVALDATVVEAAASRFRTLKLEAAQQAAAQAQQRAADHPQDVRAQAAAQAATALARVAADRAARRQVKGAAAAQTTVARSDPEAVLQPRKDGAWRPAYKPSALVHESGMIVGQTVHPSSETAQVPPLLAQHQRIFTTPPITALLDANYHRGEVLVECVEQGIDVLCPAGSTRGDAGWERRGANGRFGKDRFAYAADRDVYRCPAGQELRCQGERTDRDGRVYRHYQTRACHGCALRAQCTSAKAGRSLARYPGDDYKEAMRWVLEQPLARQKYAQRRTLGERVYAELTERQGLRRFHRRGLEGVHVEFALHCMAFDLKVAVRFLGRLRSAAWLVVAVLYRRAGDAWECVGVGRAVYIDWSAR